MWIDQIDYTKKILNKYNIEKSWLNKTPNSLGLYNKPTNIPGEPGLKLHKNKLQATAEEIEEYQKQIGSLIFLALKTRPDIAFAVNYCVRFMSNPNKDHYKALNRIWDYLLLNKDYGLYYNCNGKLEIKGYCDADWAADLVDRKSTTGYTTSLSQDHYKINTNNKNNNQIDKKWNTNLISWNTKLQHSIAQSTCEAEYYALKEITNEIIYIKGFTNWTLNKLNTDQSLTPTILIDNEAARKLAENPEFHKRTKHIDIMYHFTRTQVQNKEINLVHIPSKYEIADILTKNLTNDKHKAIMEMANITKILKN